MGKNLIRVPLNPFILLIRLLAVGPLKYAIELLFEGSRAVLRIDIPEGHSCDWPTFFIYSLGCVA